MRSEDVVGGLVAEEVKNGIEGDAIIRAAKHAAWNGHSSIPEGLADIEAEARHMGTLNVWEAAWAASSGTRPSADEFSAFTKGCSALARSDATTEQIHVAAAFAGSHLNPHLYLGLDVEHLKSANVKWVRQRAVDFWSASCAAAGHFWPSADQRETVNQSIDHIQSDGGFRVHDLWAAAAAAGVYEDTDLSTALTRNLSVFEIAAQPLAGGTN